jgi:hypothetical protein
MKKNSDANKFGALGLLALLVGLFFLSALVNQVIWNEGFVPAGVSDKTIEYGTSCWLTLAYYSFMGALRGALPKADS